MQTFALALVLSSVPALLGQNGYITTVAGDGTTGTAGVDGPATSASLAGGMIAVDSSDNLYIADRGNNRVVRVDAVSGILTVLAGTGIASSTGDGGPAVLAGVNGPSDVVLDSSGNLFISETYGNRVRRVDANTGIITTYAGTGVGSFSGDGGPATSGTLHNPFGIALDATGNLYIADTQNFRVRRVDASTGSLTTVAGTGVNAFSPDGTPAYSASLFFPIAVSFDPQGNLLITEAYAYDIRRVLNGLLTTFAGNRGTTFNGDGEPATSAAIGMLASNVTADSAGNLYFADGLGRVRRVDAVTGAIVTVAGSGAGAHLQVSSAGGGSGSTTCPGNLGDNGPATIATLDGVVGIAFTSTGRLLMSDYIDCRVRSVPLPSPLLYTSTSLALSGTTLTAAISPIGGTAIPTGTVQFMQYEFIGASLPLASAPVSNGAATLDTSSFPAGSYQVMAIYSGDSSYNGSGSIAIPVTGSGLATPTFGATVPYPVLVSTPVTIPITVAGSHGTPTGSISLSDGGTFLTTLPLVNGTASLTFSSSVTGAHQITVQYPGDTNYTTASWTFTVTVLVPSTVSVTADKNPATAGAAVTLSAAVSPSTATGRISFYDGGTFLGASSLTGGAAALAVSTLTAGTHAITASYSGDFVVAPANSGAFTETIAPTSSVALTTSGSPSIYAQAVTFTATVSPATATGTVQFLDGATLLGTATIGAGGAQFSTATLTGGSHTITAAYSGDSANAPATSAPLAQSVSSATPTLTVTSMNNPTTVGSFVLFSMSITPRSPGAVLQVLDGTTVLATVTTSSTGGASYSTTTLTAGFHSITASWAGDANVSPGTSPAYSEQIQAPTTTSLTASGPVTYGQSVTLTATVSPATATGNVQFNDGGSNLGTIPVVNGVASVSYVPNIGGAHLAVATFVDPTYIYFPSNASVNINVATLTPAITVATAPNPSNVGQVVALTAKLSFVPDGSTVNFYDGTTFVGAANLSGGTAAVNYIFRTPGSHSVTANYSGNVDYTAVTSAAVVQNVKTVTTTTLSTSGTSNYGQPVQLVATVAPSTATGTVQFLDGASPLGTVTLASGSAALSVSTFGVGSHSITAVYSGDTADTGSTSAAATLTVNKNASATTLSASSGAISFGQSVALTASVSPASAAGSIQFFDGATVIGAVALTGGSATLVIGNFTVGAHTISASYGGDGATLPSTSGAVSVTVVRAASAVGVGSSLNPSLTGQGVTFTALVSPATATGAVQFQDGGTVIGTVALANGSASLTISNLAAGSHSITAVYGGDANYNGAVSAALTQSVLIATRTTLTANKTIANPGQNVRFTAYVSPSAAPGTATFMDGATPLATVPVNSGSATVQISTLTAGTHTITAIYNGAAGYAPSTSQAVAVTIR